MSYLQRLKEKQKAQQRVSETEAQNDRKAQQEQSKPKQIEAVHQDKPEAVNDPYSPQAAGMIQCKTCQYWNYSQCRHKDYGSADPERWRRCNGYNN